MATHHRHLPKKPPRCSSHQCPVNFQKYWNKTSVVIQTSFSHYINIWLVKIEKFVKNRNIWQSAKRITHTEEHTQRSKCVKFQDSYFENQPQECQNVTIEFCFTMRIFYELRYTVIIEIVWTFYLKSVPAKFQKYFKLISWVISGTNSSKLSCNPRHPSRNISCNHRHHLLQPSWRRIFSTSNNQKTRVDSDINIDYKAFSFDKLYIWRRKWDTAGFVRAHQRKIEMRSPSAAAMLTMVTAATIVRFSPVKTADGTAVVAEWLRRWTRNPLGSARTGSNPVVCVKIL